MSSDHESSTLSKQEKTDRVIAVIVVVLFIATALFFMTGIEEPETIQEITTTATQEDVPYDNIELPEQEEANDDMELEIEGKTYKMDRETSRTIDRSYHYRAVDDSTSTYGVIEVLEEGDQTERIGTAPHDHDHHQHDDHVANNEDEIQQASPAKELAEQVAVVETAIANPAEEQVAESVEQPVIETQKPEINSTVDAQPAECVIIIGAYKNASNVSRLRNRLESDSYDHFTVPYKDLTRVGVRVSCDAQSYSPILNTIRSSYAQDAVLLQPK